jgi:hypothetical protein
MTTTAYCSAVLDHPADEVWEIVRDFNSYSVWVNGVSESHIEDGLTGTAVGAVRNFAMANGRTRQRLLAHSDADRFFTYASCGPLQVEVDGSARALTRYEGTLRLRPITEGNCCLAEWSSIYECSDTDAAYWAEWWAASLPTWLSSLRDHLHRIRQMRR